MRLLLFTDTIADVNGVARFVRLIAGRAHALGRDVLVLSSTRVILPEDAAVLPNLRVIPPRCACAMPAYSGLELALPRVGELMRAAREFDPDVVHVSTPGPVGWAGVRIARRLGVPVLGVYHTDFPAYVEALLGNPSATWASEKWMRFFYKGFARVLTRSAGYAREVEALGVPGHRVVRLRPGVALDHFSPGLRDDRVYGWLGVFPEEVRVLYVGRVSEEKNFAMLTAAWNAAHARLSGLGVPARLVIVGDGPFRARAEAAARGAVFAGVRHGRELSAFYAGADLFVFPSATDTLGQVVMEALASGLPVLVSDRGGPREVVLEGETGLVLPWADESAWTRAIMELCVDAPKRRLMGAKAYEAMQGCSFGRSFEHFWGVHADTVRARSPR